MQLATRPPLRRLLALDQLIRQGGYPNATTMASELEVHPRTIHRDLEFLRDSLRAPLEYCRRRHGFYYSDPNYPVPLLRLSEGELVAVCLAERVMQQYRGTPYERDLAGAFRKLTAALPDEVTLDLSHLADSVSFRGPGTDVGDLGRFKRLVRAVREGRQLELVYWTASRDETCTRVVDPYHLTSITGEMYLIAYCHLREDLRMFVPGRVRSARETGVHFERPADFRVDDYLDGCFRVMHGDGAPRRVRLLFTAEAARFVREKDWHPSQRRRERRDGRLELTLHVTHLGEVQRWVLSYGADCEVLEPAELRRQVAEELRRSLRLYDLAGQV